MNPEEVAKLIADRKQLIDSIVSVYGSGNPNDEQVKENLPFIVDEVLIICNFEKYDEILFPLWTTIWEMGSQLHSSLSSPEGDEALAKSVQVGDTTVTRMSEVEAWSIQQKFNPIKKLYLPKLYRFRKFKR